MARVDIERLQSEAREMSEQWDRSDVRFFRVEGQTQLYFHVLPPAKDGGPIGKIVYKWWLPKAWGIKPLTALQTWGEAERDPIAIAVARVERHLDETTRNDLRPRARACINALIRGSKKIFGPHQFGPFAAYQNADGTGHLPCVFELPPSVMNELYKHVHTLGDFLSYPQSVLWILDATGEGMRGPNRRRYTLSFAGSRGLGETQADRVDLSETAAHWDFDKHLVDVDTLAVKPENLEQYERAAETILRLYGAPVAPGVSVPGMPGMGMMPGMPGMPPGMMPGMPGMPGMGMPGMPPGVPGMPTQGMPYSMPIPGTSFGAALRDGAPAPLPTPALGQIPGVPVSAPSYAPQPVQQQAPQPAPQPQQASPSYVPPPALQQAPQSAPGFAPAPAIPAPAPSAPAPAPQQAPPQQQQQQAPPQQNYAPPAAPALPSIPGAPAFAASVPPPPPQLSAAPGGAAVPFPVSLPAGSPSSTSQAASPPPALPAAKDAESSAPPAKKKRGRPRKSKEAAPAMPMPPALGAPPAAPAPPAPPAPPALAPAPAPSMSPAVAPAPPSPAPPPAPPVQSGDLATVWQTYATTPMNQAAPAVWPSGDRGGMPLCYQHFDSVQRGPNASWCQACLYATACKLTQVPVKG